MLYADLMISTACDGDRPSYARQLMTVEDCIEEYKRKKPPTWKRLSKILISPIISRMGRNEKDGE